MFPYLREPLVELSSATQFEKAVRASCLASSPFFDAGSTMVFHYMSFVDPWKGFSGQNFRSFQVRKFSASPICVVRLVCLQLKRTHPILDI
ncbi:hypothetical protein SCLCIDRAFT_209703 [Scleroderma citrinum Foug A]|uniref:Uncharacterized protein n=1 Tax=Scleroderma citrinum Foug A TaxID=1036808 RepID=A0A0C3D7I2_9AGAM|nr:hypothetical protein SCLCIDRAFT_209703 [Scleroderma citrinum Foug A]